MNTASGVIKKWIQGRLGIHLVMDAAHPNAFTWATVELALALDALGVSVSIPPAVIHSSIPESRAVVLRRLMRRPAERAVHVKWSHFWPHHLRAPLFGDVNVEIMCTNYRYREGAGHLDPWMRHVQCNTYRKVAVSTFNQHALADLGFAAEDCPGIPLGYSPEMDALFPNGRPPKREGDDFHVLLVTNSHDLYRYGTDIALKAFSAAFSDNPNVVLHLKDYGASSDSLLSSWLKEHPVRKVVWHNDFLKKEELLKLYASMDLLLAPFRGEGFSMKILDAMALGVPVMMPRFGGPADYAVEGAFLPVKFREVAVGPCSDRASWPLGDEITWCEAEESDLICQLRVAQASPEMLQQVGARAREAVVPRYAWSRIAQDWLNVLAGWHEAYRLTVLSRSRPEEKALSVIMPTKNRLDVLPDTLRALARQNISPDQWELLIVNDYGDFKALQEVCTAQASGLPLQLIDNSGESGRSPARNLGIERACGRLLLFMGDDIIPEDDAFLQHHLDAHQRHPEHTSAFLGYTGWDETMPSSVFMDMLVGEGGHQFNYSDCRPGEEISYHKFYTSNVSLSRAFLLEQEQLFDPMFPYGFEDIELAYRLHLRGMIFRYLPEARAGHRHPQSPERYLERQRHIGEDLFLFALKQPSTDLARDWMPSIFSLEKNRHAGWPGLPIDFHPEILLKEILGLYETAIRWMDHPVVHADEEWTRWRDWIGKTHRGIWECANEIALREGVARAWKQASEEEAPAVAWSVLLGLSRVTGPNAFYHQMPGASGDASPAAEAPVFFRDSPFMYHLSHALRTCPLLGRIVCAVETSAAMRRLKSRLITLKQA
ncbi:MAG: glycosyltransferase [Kiritimatiellae bacterium]|nr:glycosyltransferase [Kiritimatiellia bacterium]